MKHHSRSITFTNLSHTAINNEVLTVDERALVGSKEQDCLSLLDGFTETTRWKMNLAAVTLGCVVT